MNIALIGCGYWGKNLARNLYSLGVLKYLVDIDDDNLTTLSNQYNVETFYDYTELPLDRLDGVVIATPPEQHYFAAKYFLSKGINTFIEKPMTVSVNTASELNEIAVSNNTVLMVGHTFLYSNELKYIKNYVDSGKLGKIFSITSRRLNLGIIQKHCNVVWDLAPHDIAVFNYLLNQKGPLGINGTITSFLGTEIEEEALLTLKYKQGIICNLHLSWLHPRKIRKTVIVGSKAMLTYDMLAEDKIRIYDKGVSLDKVDDKASTNYGSHLLSYRYGDVVSPFIEVGEPLYEELKEFVECIVTGEQPLSDGCVGYNVVSVLERMDRLQGATYVR